MASSPRRVRVPQFRRELEQPRQDSSGSEREAEHLADLPEDDADGDPVHEADEHGLAEKIGQNPSLNMPATMHATPENTASVTASVV